MLSGTRAKGVDVDPPEDQGEPRQAACEGAAGLRRSASSRTVNESIAGEWRQLAGLRRHS